MPDSKKGANYQSSSKIFDRGNDRGRSPAYSSKCELVYSECDVPVENAWRALSRKPYPVFIGGQTRGVTYVTADPVMLLHFTSGDTGGKMSVLTGEFKLSSSNPNQITLDVLEKLLAESPVPDEGPLPFSGGWVIALGYDAARNQNSPDSSQKAGDAPLDVPVEMVIGLYDVVYGYDHKSNKGWLMSTGHTDVTTANKLNAQQRLDNFERIIEGPTLASNMPLVPIDTHVASDEMSLAANLTGAQYRERVAKVLEYIAAGDIYQVNLSLMLNGQTRVSPIELSDKLRVINPSPNHMYFDAGPWQLVSNSPERFLTVNQHNICTSPIKGTRPRGINVEDDFRLIEELRTNEKELAELRMIVDLMRNDLGRVAEIGSVNVPVAERIETYSHVHHMLTDVEARLAEGVSFVDILRATFPGGSITGCPKIRAIEVIEELEPHRRGFYTGAMGFISGDCMDLNVGIRTAIMRQSEGHSNIWDIVLGVGSGIVAESNPEAEYVETLTKAKAFAEVLGVSIDAD